MVIKLCAINLAILLGMPRNMKTYRQAIEDYGERRDYIFEYKELNDQLIINIYSGDGEFIKRYIN